MVSFTPVIIKVVTMKNTDYFRYEKKTIMCYCQIDTFCLSAKVNGEFNFEMEFFTDWLIACLPNAFRLILHGLKPTKACFLSFYPC